MYLKAKIPYTQHKFLAFNTYLFSFFFRKSDAKIYIMNSQSKNTNPKGDFVLKSQFEMYVCFIDFWHTKINLKYIL